VSVAFDPDAYAIVNGETPPPRIGPPELDTAVGSMPQSASRRQKRPFSR
jgi:hypothetical protein